MYMLAKQDILKEWTCLGVAFAAQEASAFCQCVYTEPALLLPGLPRDGRPAPAGTSTAGRAWLLWEFLSFEWSIFFSERPIPIETIHFFSVYVDYWDGACLPCYYSIVYKTLPQGWEIFLRWGQLLEAGCVIISTFHQHCQVLKHFFYFLEIHNLINLAKYMWPLLTNKSWIYIGLRTDLKLVLSSSFL